jgi:galactonate dehydratase
MKIVEINTRRPSIQPNLLFVELVTDAGLVGLGESFFGAKAVEAYIHETAAPALFASGATGPEAVSLLLNPYLGYQGAGAETRGRAAVDLALWDLLGQETERPLVELLGGPVVERLRIYNTCAGADYVRASTQQSSSNWGLPPSDSTRMWEDLDAFLNRPRELTAELMAEGLTAMKVWPFDRPAERSRGTEISTAELDEALNIVAQIREIGGKDLDIMIELHGLWTLSPAKRILRELSQFNPYWVEDPIRPDSVAALSELRRQVDVPIAIGETAVGRRGFLPMLQEGIVDFATVDVQWSGGLTEARKVAGLADQFSVPIAPHDCTGPATLAASAHLTASQPNGLIQETVRAFLRTWYADLTVGLPEIRHGELILNMAPGHGVKIKPELHDSPMFSVQTSRRVST